MFQKHVMLFGLCARYWQHVQLYIGFTHFMIDNMCNFALVLHIFWHAFAFFTTFGFSARLSENAWFYLGFVHAIDNLCDFALVMAYVVSFYTCFKTCNVTWVLCTLLTTCATLQRFHMFNAFSHVHNACSFTWSSIISDNNLCFRLWASSFTGCAGPRSGVNSHPVGMCEAKRFANLWEVETGTPPRPSPPDSDTPADPGTFLGHLFF